MNKEFFLQNLWRWKCNLPEKKIQQKIFSLSELQKTEWNFEFEQLMRNRLIIGGLKYGRLKGSNKPKYNIINAIKQRSEIYEKTGNKELLVDIANFALLEFSECNHPKAHFNTISEHNFHAKIK